MPLNFKFACYDPLQQKCIFTYSACLCRVDGRILAGVLLTSFFCVVPESLRFSNVESSSLSIAWSSNNFGVTKGPSQQWLYWTRGGRNWWLCSFFHFMWTTIWVHRKTLPRLHPHRSHIVLSYYNKSLTLSSYSLNQFDTTALGIYGIYKSLQIS